MFSQKTMTGGAVFCRHWRMWTIFPSCLTYSTSWMTSRLAAPALPTLTMTGSTRDLLAKERIFSGMVAENNMVWRWDCGQRARVKDKGQGGEGGQNQ